MSIKYIITALNTSTCIYDYEVPHFCRFNNIKQSSLELVSYSSSTRTNYVKLDSEITGNYKSKRNTLILK